MAKFYCVGCGTHYEIGDDDFSKIKKGEEKFRCKVCGTSKKPLKFDSQSGPKSAIFCPDCGTRYVLTQKDAEHYTCIICQIKREQKFQRETQKGKYSLYSYQKRVGKELETKTTFVSLDRVDHLNKVPKFIDLLEEEKLKFIQKEWNINEREAKKTLEQYHTRLKKHIGLKWHERRDVSKLLEKGEIKTVRKPFAVPSNKGEVSHRVEFYGEKQSGTLKFLTSVEVYAPKSEAKHHKGKCEEGLYTATEENIFVGLSPKRRKRIKAKDPKKYKSFLNAYDDIKFRDKVKLKAYGRKHDIYKVEYAGKTYYIPSESIKRVTKKKGCLACTSERVARERALKWFQSDYLPYVGSSFGQMHYVRTAITAKNLVLDPRERSRGIEWKKYTGEGQKTYPTRVMPKIEKQPIDRLTTAERDTVRKMKEPYGSQFLYETDRKTHMPVPRKKVSIQMKENHPAFEHEGKVYPSDGKRYLKRGNLYIVPFNVAHHLVQVEKSAMAVSSSVQDVAPATSRAPKSLLQIFDLSPTFESKIRKKIGDRLRESETKKKQKRTKYSKRRKTFV